MAYPLQEKKNFFKQYLDICADQTKLWNLKKRKITIDTQSDFLFKLTCRDKDMVVSSEANRIPQCRTIAWY